jgi:acetyl-CoA C-acetyltransferase
MAIATAAKQIIVDGMQIAVGGGLESISLVQNEHMNMPPRSRTRRWSRGCPASTCRCWRRPRSWPTATACRREAQDEYACSPSSAPRRPRRKGRFDAEIVPMTTMQDPQDKETGETSRRRGHPHQDEGNRPRPRSKTSRSWPGVQGRPVRQGALHHRGQRQPAVRRGLACVLMEAGEAERRGLTPLGAYRGMAVAGCDPDEMGIGPVFAVPKLLKQAWADGRRHRPVGAERGLRQPGALLPRHPGHPQRAAQRVGGAISIGHPYGMSGARMHRAHPARGQAARREVRVVTMCVGGGMGAAGLFEIF